MPIPPPTGTEGAEVPDQTEPPHELSDREVRAVDGRVPGRRGQATRTRLLECTAALSRTTALRDLRVVDIAREAGTSPATFYQYFADVEGALIELGEELARDGAEHLAAPLAGGGDPGVVAAALVDRFLTFFAENQHLLRVIDLAVLEGDERFRAIRSHLLGPVTTALAQAAGSEDQRPDAGVAVAMLAHVAAHRASGETAGYTDTDIRHALARNLSAALLA